MSLPNLIHCLPIGPVILDLDTEHMIYNAVFVRFFYNKFNILGGICRHVTNLLKGPPIMCMLCKFVDEGV